MNFIVGFLYIFGGCFGMLILSILNWIYLFIDLEDIFIEFVNFDGIILFE